MMERLELFLARRFGYWAAAITSVMLLMVAASLYTLTVSYWRGPFRDMWEVMPFIEKALQGHASIADYWEQYGYSHRPLVSRLLWVMDVRWFAGSNFFLLITSIFMQMVILAVLGCALFADSSYLKKQKLVLLVMLVYCLFNSTQNFNFLHTFDVQWFLASAFAVASCACIVYGKRVSGFLFVSLFCIVVASMNNFSGIMIFPVNCLLLLALRYPWHRVLVFVLLGAAYLACYFYRLTGEGAGTGLSLPPDGLFLQAALVVLVTFPLNYLASPLSFQLSAMGPLHAPAFLAVVPALLVGLLLLPILLAWWRGVFRYRHYSSLAWLGLSLLLYAYCVGVVTAVGRALFWENVYALRYQNIVLLFWMGLVLWLPTTVQKKNIGIFISGFLLLLVLGTSTSWCNDLIIKTGNRVRDAHLALRVGLESQLSAIKATVSRSHLNEGSRYELSREAGFLKRIGAGPYADPAWQTPSAAERTNAAVCGVNAANIAVHGEESGYARLSLTLDKAADFSMVAWFDQDEINPGLLLADHADTFMKRLRESFQGSTTFSGFSLNLPALAPLNIYAKSDDGWCKLKVL